MVAKYNQRQDQSLADIKTAVLLALEEETLFSEQSGSELTLSRNEVSERKMFKVKKGPD